MTERSFRHSFVVEHLSEVDSTNALARRFVQARATAVPPYAWVADVQTAGRGQHGRSWHAASGDALLLSVAWQFGDHTPLQGLSLAVVVLAVQALTTLPGVNSERIGLKWPNDLLLDGERKLGGILIEALPTAGGRVAVIGIGLNLHGVPSLAAPAAGSVVGALPPACLDEVAAAPPSRDAVLDALLAAFESGLPLFASNGFAAFRARWCSLHALQHRTVHALLPDGRELQGVVQDVADNGALLLATDAGLHTLVSGEVSLRAART